MCHTWGEEECVQDFGGIANKKRPLRKNRCRLEDSIKMDRIDIGWGDMYWINLAQDKDQWRTYANIIMNLLFPKILGNSCIAELLVASQE
jgi:hypothetical protein